MLERSKRICCVTPFKALFQKEMTRKEFIVTLGVVAATVIGLSSIIKLLTGKDIRPSVVSNDRAAKYGHKKV
jgi:hypothetical protein